MVADHKTSAELQGLVSRGQVKAELPTALDSSHRSKLEAQGRERQGLQFGFFA
jgi:putative membrane protein